MNLEKFTAQKAAGITVSMDKVGPDTVVLLQPKFCPNTGVALDPDQVQLNLQLIDDAVDSVTGQRDALNATLVQLAALRGDLTKKLSK